ncbi:hypothetical protein HHI36_008593 [Cryptolaemus montrouzieri]|uniref:Uncharacterized protein n=1 Tax=Cryptolaemus montrouzieri TaxID=559131 RepID=A0ABD2MTF9_9CUCU
MASFNANGEVTDEVSGNVDQVRPSNLPGSQLSAPGKIYLDNRNQDEDFDSEDEISLAELTRKLKEERKKRRIIIGKWRPRSLANGMAIFHRC